MTPHLPFFFGAFAPFSDTELLAKVYLVLALLSTVYHEEGKVEM